MKKEDIGEKGGPEYNGDHHLAIVPRALRQKKETDENPSSFTKEGVPPESEQGKKERKLL